VQLNGTFIERHHRFLRIHRLGQRIEHVFHGESYLDLLTRFSFAQPDGVEVDPTKSRWVALLGRVPAFRR
jgi:hypothetical protein